MYLNFRNTTEKDMKRLKRTAAAAAAKSLQSCPTLCDPRDGSPPSSPVPGILQARTLVGATAKTGDEIPENIPRDYDLVIVIGPSPAKSSE